MSIQRWAEILHVGVPIRLRRATPLLGITLADGVYLTAWPLLAVLAPAVVFVFGFSVGGWHWLPHNIWDGGVSAYPAVAFMQMLPLLVIAAAVGALSAGLGLLLVAGYALGDLFISGATYAPYFHRFSLGWWLGHVVTAQLVTYLVFVLLAVMPTVFARALAASVPGLRATATGSIRATLRALVGAALAGLVVYAWTYMAPMAVRPLWLWATPSSPPVTVAYFTAVVNPMLPLVAAGFMLVRALIQALASHDEDVKRHVARLVPAYPEPSPARAVAIDVSGALAAALLATLLLAGLITRLRPTGIVVFVAVLALFTAHRIALPRWAGWRAWTRLAGRVPLILRWLGVVVGAYVTGRAVLALPGLGAAENEAAGTFGAELSAVVLGLILAAVLLPVPARSTTDPGSSTPVSAKALLQMLVLIGIASLAMHANPAWARCVAAGCCFVNNMRAALFAAGSTVVISIFGLIRHDDPPPPPTHEIDGIGIRG